MRKTFTYLFALVLFLGCAMNYDIIPGNLSEKVTGFVSRNVKKDRAELFSDMKHITKQGLIRFEIYDEAGQLIAILKEPKDFEDKLEQTFDKSKMVIKSVSNTQLKANLDLISLP